MITSEELQEIQSIINRFHVIAGPGEVDIQLDEKLDRLLEEVYALRIQFEERDAALVQALQKNSLLQAEVEKWQKRSDTQYKVIVGRDELFERTVKELNGVRKYIMSHDILLGECTGWIALKKMYGVGEYEKK